MNAHQFEAIVTAGVLVLLGWFLWHIRGHRSIALDNCVSEYGVRVLTAKDRLDMYEAKLPKDESQLRLVANGIAVQKTLIERTKQIPRHRALVVIAPPAKSNVVRLPTGQAVPVIWRERRMRVAR